MTDAETYMPLGTAEPDHDQNPEYKNHYPDVVEDPILAQEVAKSTKSMEEKMRTLASEAKLYASEGDHNRATKILEDMRNMKEKIEVRYKSIKEIYEEIEQMLHGS